jgi:hypothetical protein
VQVTCILYEAFLPRATSQLTPVSGLDGHVDARLYFGYYKIKRMSNKIMLGINI